MKSAQGEKSNDNSPGLMQGQKLSVKIEKLLFGGAGLARHSNQVIFVDNVAPLDEVLIEITEVKKNYVIARLLEIQKPGPSRIQPPCRVAGTCGGCSWQHITYEEQLKQKQNILKESFEKHLKAQDFIFHSIQSSPKTLRYRNRIQLKNVDGQVGYFKKSSHSLVAIEDCLLADEKIAAQIKNLKFDKNVEHIELKLSQDLEVQTILNKNSDESLGFSQVNEDQNQLLIQTCLEWMGDAKNSEIYDLYAGSGNFSFPILAANKKATIKAVELSSAAVKWGQELTQKKQISPKQISFFRSDVGSFLKRIPYSPDAIAVIDPPRAGCDSDVVKSLSAIGFKKIIYISCNFTSFIRDINNLSGYRLKQIQPVDMFPQTDHIEIIAELERIESAAT